MKRSKALTKIGHVISSFLHKNTIEGFNIKKIDELSNEILNKIENEIDMLPPDNNTCSCGGCWTYEWEPEE